MRASSFVLHRDDGLELVVYSWQPEQPRAALQIAHGAAEHAGRYARLAERLAHAGYAVYANDHRGHGRTARSERELGALAECGGFERAVSDLAALNAHLRGLHPGLPIALLGHSLGSFLVQQYLCEYGATLTAAILSGSTQLAALPELPPPAPGAPAVEPFALLNAPFEPARTPFDWLSRDPDEVDRYLADPHCGFALSAATVAELGRLSERLYAPERLARIPRDLPLYLFAGDRDPLNQGLSGLEALVETYRAAGLRRLELRSYAGGRHEMLNETNREQVMDDLVQWLEAALFAAVAPNPAERS